MSEIVALERGEEDVFLGRKDSKYLSWTLAVYGCCELTNESLTVEHYSSLNRIRLELSFSFHLAALILNELLLHIIRSWTVLSKEFWVWFDPVNRSVVS